MFVTWKDSVSRQVIHVIEMSETCVSKVPNMYKDDTLTNSFQPRRLSIHSEGRPQAPVLPYYLCREKNRQVRIKVDVWECEREQGN